MKEVKVLSEEKLNFLQKYEPKIADMYLLVENECQSDIDLSEAVYFTERFYHLYLNDEELNTYKNHLEEENKLLREIIIQKELELHNLKSV